MTDAWDTPERQALRDSVTRFARDEVVPHLAEWEDAGEVPRALHAKAARAGLLAVGFAEGVGGAGGDLVDVAVLTEALIEAGGSGGLVAALFTHAIALPPLVAAAGHAQSVASGTGTGPDAGAAGRELVDRYVRPTLAGHTIGALGVTEPGGGSDVAGITTRARREDDVFVVDGAKTFITSGARADFVTTAVRTGADAGSAGISLLVIDKGLEGFTVTRPLRTMGWHCSDTAELTFDQVRVPAGNLVGELGGGFGQLGRQFVTERLSLAVQAYATAQRALDLAVGYARQRGTFGRPLIDRQVIRHKLVDMHRRTTTARAYTRQVVERAAGVDDGETAQTPAARTPAALERLGLDACIAKNDAVQACDAVVDEAVQIFGAAGYLRDSEIERHYRDSRVLGIGGGASEVLDDLAARLLGYTSSGGAR